MKQAAASYSSGSTVTGGAVTPASLLARRRPHRRAASRVERAGMV
ncbi:MAG: hypothetical protein AVDCRST_MAG87-856 [uncultured Thermomicrobiales bacterium]|uniref:Uncharacterized protein n=1 Tax=uncultured Thermomicrobiales bacterium TaxID=1645740 RepID=A0A6J4UJ78_9BACT|nr:MAG: hypothetical protein AVDCRST_MAG87-856 [uncultured Thermomicrobiales bacterium]